MSTLVRRPALLSSLPLASLALALAPAAFGATLVVDTLVDVDAADGLCSFREALVAADTDAAHGDCPAGEGRDRIEFAVVGTIELGADLPVLAASLDIAGPGAAELAIRGNGHRMLFLDGDPDGQTLDVSGLVLRGGTHAESGGCLAVDDEDHLVLTDARVLQCFSGESGGGVAGDRAASLRIVRSRIAENGAAAGGGGVALIGVPVPPEQELVNELWIEDSTISGNEVFADDVGGGIGVVFARLTVRQSTVSGNLAEFLGGGIFAGASEVVVERSTVVLNEASPPPPLSRLAPLGVSAVATSALGTSEGGGLYAATVPAGGRPTTASIRSSLFAGNFSAGNRNDLAADPDSTLLSLGWNLVSTNDGVGATFPLGEPNAAEDWVGSSGAPIPAGLAPLQNNGGAAPTHLPQPDSLAIDHGSCPGARRDQRGFGDAATNLRTVDDPLVENTDAGCDIGAVEAGAVELPFLLLVDGFESGGTDAWSEVLGQLPTLR